MATPLDSASNLPADSAEEPSFHITPNRETPVFRLFEFD